MDSYTEPVIEFTSCSYLPEYTMEIYNTNTTYGNETATNTHVNTGDFAYDIAQIALTQVGYLEKESNSQLDSKTANAGDGNWTKYHTDLGYNHSCDWCAIFVTWCAKNADLDIGQRNNDHYDGLVIPSEPSVQQMREYYEGIGRYYNSSTYTPQMGDIFFMQGNGISHVGLVVDVTATTIYAVHGNSSERVKYSTYSLTGSSITGFASPNYDMVNTNTHNYECINHTSSLSHTCINCKKVKAAELICDHTGIPIQSCSLCDYTASGSWIGDHSSTLYHACSLCSYTKIASTDFFSHNHNSSTHWMTCSICNDTWNEGIHMWVAINGGEDGYSCRVCGRHTYSITLNKSTPLIQLLNE